MADAELTYSQAFRSALQEEMERDPHIFIMGTDLFLRGGHFSQVEGLGEQFGRERVRDCPISEAAMVAAGVGAALNGLRPVVDINFIDFALSGMDEIVNQAAKIRYMWGVSVPLVIRATSGVANFGAQHNNSLESWFSHIPGLAVVMPSTPRDVKGLMKTALRGQDPVIFMMHKRLTGAKGEAGFADELIPFGKAAVRRPGEDVTVVSYSYMVEVSLAAARALEADDVSVEVIDIRTAYPLDVGAINASVEKTGRLVVVSEAPTHCSLASEIAASVQETAFASLQQPVCRVGAAHSPIPHSPPLIKALVPSVDDVVLAVRTTIGRPAIS